MKLEVYEKINEQALKERKAGAGDWYVVDGIFTALPPRCAFCEGPDDFDKNEQKIYYHIVQVGIDPDLVDEWDGEVYMPAWEMDVCPSCFGRITEYYRDIKGYEWTVGRDYRPGTHMCEHEDCEETDYVIICYMCGDWESVGISAHAPREYIDDAITQTWDFHYRTRHGVREWK